MKTPLCENGRRQDSSNGRRRGNDALRRWRGARASEARPRQVYDVTGAGDTVLATMALAVACGAEYRDAMQLAVAAASVAIGIMGTVAVTAAQLESFLNGDSPVCGLKRSVLIGHPRLPPRLASCPREELAARARHAK